MSPLAEIPFSSLEAMSLPLQARITEFRHLASYNWIESPIATIAVPGSPAKWSPPNGPTRLRKDTGDFYTAQNAARHPESPLEPLFRALLLADPLVDLRSVDIVTDRNNIRKLLSFVEPSTARNGVKDFSIGVEVVGKTALFSREENEVHEYIAPGDFRGYGHEFEKTYTQCQIHGSTGHHRISAYHFGGLSFLVRSTIDGYVPRPSKGETGTCTTSNLADELSSLALSEAPASCLWAGSELRVRMEGETIPAEQCLEVKTRVAHKPLGMQDVMPQIWASQTPKLVRAYHSRGLFHPPAVEDVSEDMKRWENDNQGTLRKLAAVIARILGVARLHGKPIQVKYTVADNQLVLRGNGSEKKMLPKDLYSKWDTTTLTETTDSPHTKIVHTASDNKAAITATKVEKC